MRQVWSILGGILVVALFASLFDYSTIVYADNQTSTNSTSSTPDVTSTSITASPTTVNAGGSVTL
ncbi:MAG TPA: hypothetical protein VEJ68_05860, partial [Candidatus Bathyarchaeia archaeon]|nr:hypothetical protein [Candidatus Bathyarchaeia archaeon]